MDPVFSISRRKNPFSSKNTHVVPLQRVLLVCQIQTVFTMFRKKAQRIMLTKSTELPVSFTSKPGWYSYVWYVKRRWVLKTHEWWASYSADLHEIVSKRYTKLTILCVAQDSWSRCRKFSTLLFAKSNYWLSVTPSSNNWIKDNQRESRLLVSCY